MRPALACLVLLLVAGCTERVRRSELPGAVAGEESTEWARTGSAYAPVTQRWRFAGTRGDEHIVVFRSAKREYTFALQAREFVMPVAMAYTKDESRWIPLKEVRRVRADGSVDLDFVRLPAVEIDAVRDPTLRKDAVRRGGL